MSTTPTPSTTSSDQKSGLGTWSTLSIGLGGMVGGGIFAVTGLAVQITRGAAPIAFLIAGIVALLTAWSYLRLSLRYPGEGGTVDFLNRAFGTGVITGAANIMLLLSYVVLVSVYAYAFGSYGSGFFPLAHQPLWTHLLASGVILGLVLVNALGGTLVIRAENLFNTLKLILLGAFILAGFLTPLDWHRLAPESYVSPLGIASGAMLIFLNYEGFELIANASKDVANPKRSLPIAYLGGVLIVIVIYMLIAVVVVGHLDFAQVAASSDNALSAAAQSFMGRAGFIAIAVAALLATSSAINATFYSTGKLAFIIAKSSELPARFERSFRGQHLAGTVITALLAIVVVNFVPLDAIATMGSAGFLLIFMAVNVANLRLARETGGRRWLSATAAAAAAIALVMLCVQVDENPATRNHLWILAGMIAASFTIEIIYRRLSGRHLHLIGPGHHKLPKS
jgi:amino acid transporter